MGLGDFFSDLAGAALPIAGGAIGTAIGGPLGGKIGAGLGSAVGGAFGGGGQQSGSGQRVAGTALSGGIPLDYYALYGDAAARAQLPVTLAATRYGAASTGNIGAQSLLAQALGAGSMTALQDAAQRGTGATNLVLDETRTLLDTGIGLQKDLAQAQLGVALQDPQFLAQSATSAREGEKDLAVSLGKLNQNLRGLQEAAKTNIATQFAQDLGSIAKTRALTSGSLATGAQRIAGQLALGDQNIVGNLTLNKAKVEGDLSRIRANTEATKLLRANAAQYALLGQRNFA